MFRKSSLSRFPAATLEEKDFKFALKPQHEEVDSPETIQVSSTCLGADSPGTTNSIDLEVEANAAAALLQLQQNNKVYRNTSTMVT